MSRLLVTGGAGFIGANFVRYWLDKYPSDYIVVLDALTYAGNVNNLANVQDLPNFRFVTGDICDQALVELLLKDEQLDTIVHFAAESHVDRSISGPAAFVQTNINGTYHLLEAARTIWLNGSSGRIAHRFHHISTDEVYGTLGPDDLAFTENTPYAPNSPYAASKAASDHLVRSYHHTYGLNVTTSNCSNNYGYFQFPEKLIPLCLINMLHGKPLPVYGDGRQIRDWLFVDDHCHGIDLVINSGRVGETYNIGGINERCNIDIVKLLCEQVDSRFAADSSLAQRFPDAMPAKGSSSSELIEFVEDRPGHDRRYAVATDKIETELGYRPQTSFADGIAKTIDWYLDNEAWWRSQSGG